MGKNLLYYLAFSCFPGIGPVKFKRIVGTFKSLSKAYWATKDELDQFLDASTVDRFISFRYSFDPVKKLEELKRKDIEVISQENARYVDNLKNLSDPPICLYIKGDIKKANYFSVVGTRYPTLYGQKVAYEISYGLVNAGFSIVSGMAQGIDGLAHWAAIDAKGITVAVLGCVDFIYPKIHQELYWKIISSGGAIVSEFPPGLSLVKGMFVSRNRIISGFSRGVLIVEGGEHSGTLITASYAGNQGKDIFAVPGQITNKYSIAPNILLKQGAKLVTQVEDILEEYRSVNG